MTRVGSAPPNQTFANSALDTSSQLIGKRVSKASFAPISLKVVMKTIAKIVFGILCPFYGLYQAYKMLTASSPVISMPALQQQASTSPLHTLCKTVSNYPKTYIATTLAAGALGVLYFTGVHKPILTALPPLFKDLTDKCKEIFSSVLATSLSEFSKVCPTTPNLPCQVDSF